MSLYNMNLNEKYQRCMDNEEDMKIFCGSANKNTVSISGAISIFARPIWNSKSKSVAALRPRKIIVAFVFLQK